MYGSSLELKTSVTQRCDTIEGLFQPLDFKKIFHLSSSMHRPSLGWSMVIAPSPLKRFLQVSITGRQMSIM
jgi:hypothetical protein